MKPNVYRFQSLTECLQALVGHTLEERKCSLRSLSEKLKWSAGYLPLLLAGKRGITEKKLLSLFKVMPFLDRTERAYVQKLRTLRKTSDFQKKRSVYRSATRSTRMQREAPENFRMFRYLGDWVNPVVREAVSVKGFQHSEDWLRESLLYKVPRDHLRRSLEFLEEQKFIEAARGGQWRFAGKEQPACDPAVHKLALGQYHREMLLRAAESIDVVERDERQIAALTVAVSDEDFKKVAAVFEAALKQVQEIQSKSKSRDRVYHFATAAFPLTRKI
jgi:uncharacterized protein (TIGR02147 family)